MKEKIYTFIINGMSLAWVALAPVHSILIALSILVLLDFITGVMAAVKLKKKITSKGFKATVIKTFIYQSSVIVAMLIENHLMVGVPVIKVVVALITMTETKSFFENVEVMTGIDFWGKMVSKLSQALSALNTKDSK